MSAFRPANMQEAEERYGKIKRKADGTFAWPDEIKWMKLVEMPSVIRGVLNTRNRKPVTTIYCNKDMAKALIDVAELLFIRKLMPEWKTYDGCFNIRDIRGRPGELSTHAYGLAVDVNALWNPLGSKGTVSSEFVATWKELGFLWGGDFQGRRDPMHFQWFGVPSAEPLA